MSQMRRPEIDRLLELLADRATGNLTPETGAELARLVAQFPDEARANAYEDAVAGLIVAVAPPRAARLPDALRSKLLAAGRDIAAGHAARSGDAPASIPISRARSNAWLGWLAAAAALAFAAVGWWPRLVPPAPPAPVTLAQRAREVASEPGVVQVAWAPQADPRATGVSGTVVWNPMTQEGYARFAGLSPNDPNVEQYQLWVIDAGRTAPDPVDAGVFDVASAELDPATGELVVPIRPALVIRDAGAFAMTVEPSGGMVRPTLERLVVLGPVAKNEG